MSAISRRVHRPRGPVSEPLESRRLLSSTFVVTTAADAGPGSLRQAILDANATAGADAIRFAIPGGGVHRITPATALPAITDTLALDAATQPGYAGAPRVEIVNTDAAGRGRTGVRVAADDCVVRGLAIEGFERGLTIVGTGNRVEACYAGLLADGTDASAAVEGYFPTGVWVDSDATGTTIGGAATGAGNVISGNRGAGVSLRSGSDRTVVAGNLVGTNPAGDAAAPNGTGLYGYGMTGGTVIGGTVAAARNVISGNRGAGIRLDSGSVTGGLTVRGNYVGTSAAADAAVPNGGAGLDVPYPNPSGEGPYLIEQNVVAGNLGDGVLLGTDAAVRANWIGLSPTGLPLGNAGNGLTLLPLFGTTIAVGDAGSAAASNTVASNRGAGVAVMLYEGRVSIRRNAIRDNKGLGIDLGPAGPTPNDPLDYDDGPNGLQNAPRLTAVATTFAGTTITGTLHSAPGQTFAVDVYNNPAGKSQGQTYLGSTSVTTDTAGNGRFSLTVATSIFPGQSVTATATSPRGATSELSPAWAAAVAGDANRDLSVDFVDVVALAQNYDRPAPAADAWAAGDFTGDGVVNFSDLVILAQNFERDVVAAAATAARTAAATVVAAPAPRRKLPPVTRPPGSAVPKVSPAPRPSPLAAPRPRH
jgi:hypothetical protein